MLLNVINCAGGRGPGRIYLASGSPRRRELLEKAGVEFSIFVTDVDEECDQTPRAPCARPAP